MEFGLQMGHGMQGLAGEFLGDQKSANQIILSPRNFGNTRAMSGPDRMIAYAKGPIRVASGGVLLDPQLFSGGNATVSLREFPHWKVCSGSLWDNPSAVLEEVANLNDACLTSMFIIPSDTIETVNREYLDKMSKYAASAREFSGGRKTLMTLSFGQDVLRGDSSIDMLLNALEDWDVDGFYIVSEHPRNEYLVDQPLWLYNYLVLIAGIKRIGKIAYVGYGSHQLLLLALAGCDCLFSGNYLNVRRFEKSTFEDKEEGISQRACWYYAPQALSEFKVTTLDLAMSLHALDVLKTPFGDDKYAGVLFRGALPSNTAYNERASFLHYLICLNQQCKVLSKSSYDETYFALLSYFNTAQSIIDGLQEIGINDRARNFANALPAASQAIAAFNANWGFQMSQEWAYIKN